MPSKDWSGSDCEQRVHDVLEAINAIRQFTNGFDRASYCADLKTMSAVERQFLIIAEAIGKLLDAESDGDAESLEVRFPTIPWKQIRGLGNRLRHEYGRIDPAILWNAIIGDDLSDLEAVLKSQ